MESPQDRWSQPLEESSYLGAGRYRSWTKTDEFKRKMRAIVEADGFLASGGSSG
jgi:hypothetical protein